MVIVDRPMVLNTESCVVAAERWVWRDVGENGKDEFVWEFENCETGRDRLKCVIERTNTKAHTKAGLRSRKAEGLRQWDDGWEMIHNETVRESSAEPCGLFAAEIHGSVALRLDEVGEEKTCQLQPKRILSEYSQDVVLACSTVPPLKTPAQNKAIERKIAVALLAHRTEVAIRIFESIIRPMSLSMPRIMRIEGY